MSECAGCQQFRAIGVHSPEEHLAYEAALRSENERLKEYVDSHCTFLRHHSGRHEFKVRLLTAKPDPSGGAEGGG